MSQYIDEITEALNEDVVLSQMIRFPENIGELNICIDRNRALGGQLRGTLGYTDGTLVKIIKPSIRNNRAGFIGRKSFASLNAMITCDRRMYVMNVNARFPGATFDSFVFQGSALRTRMMQLNEQQPCHLLGDAGYTLEPWMMTPFNRADRPLLDDSPEARYNHAHASDRNVVERCIGALKGKFRCLHDERVLHYNYVKSGKFVNAACVIMNLGILGIPNYINEENLLNDNVNDALPEEDLFDDEDGGVRVHALLARGREIRNRIVQELEEMRN
ncbi:putative nuclease HARBI1 [Thrips palmi]|uniref:Nuclease HARBI1 n=1 Tax=Thrips palmi TaxID=161013 RepID=A0A6P8ZLM9_THRPL|nr:putative nuclease HARBI1 [Thrips palmi]